MKSKEGCGERMKVLNRIERMKMQAEIEISKNIKILEAIEGCGERMKVLNRIERMKAQAEIEISKNIKILEAIEEIDKRSIKIWCENCESFEETYKKNKITSIFIRGEEAEFEYEATYCEKCKQQIY